MQEFINIPIESYLSIAEIATMDNYPSRATEIFVAEMVSKLHVKSPEDALNWISKFNTYILKRVLLSEIDAVHSTSDQETIRKYATMDTDPPPIVIDGENGWIIDGYHRARASELRGLPYILAYVGEELNAEWQGE